jgi:hypothetical protein
MCEIIDASQKGTSEMNSTACVSTQSPAVRILTRVAGVSAILSALLLLSALAILAGRGFRPASGAGVIVQVENNWLILLAKLHLRFEGVTTEALRSQNAVDYLIMSLTGIACIGLFLTLRQATQVWSIVGLALPFAGIVLLAITHLTGRSALMAAVIVFSLIMIWTEGYGMLAVCLGLVAGTLLLVGDLSESLHSRAIGVLMLAGYVSLVAWFLVVGVRLLGFKGAVLSAG